MHPTSAQKFGTEFLSNAGTIAIFRAKLDGRNRSPPRMTIEIASGNGRARNTKNANSGHPKTAIVANQFAVMASVIELTELELSTSPSPNSR
jgi:hypothetical protein